MERSKRFVLAFGATLLLAGAAYATETGNDAPYTGSAEPPAPPPAPCTADHDDNSIVNFSDLLWVIGHWGDPAEGGGVIGFSELLEVISEYGQAC